MTIATGMITVLYLAAFGACVNLPTQGLGAAQLDGAHCLPVTRQDLICVLLAIGGTVQAKDIGQF
jgi:hypothetical protein